MRGKDRKIGEKGKKPRGGELTKDPPTPRGVWRKTIEKTTRPSHDPQDKENQQIGAPEKGCLGRWKREKKRKRPPKQAFDREKRGSKKNLFSWKPVSEKPVGLKDERDWRR